MSGFGAPPRSFGRPREEKDDGAPLVVIPPLQLPAVQVPLVLVVDHQSLEAAAGKIQELVRDAVLAGFAEAMGQMEQVTAEVAEELTTAPV